MPDPVFVYPYPVAICTLADDALAERLRAYDELEGLLIAPLRTENLGIEQIIQFCLERPTLRTLILCGADARQCVGHLPGASFVALMHHGVDARRRIVNAPGKRPVLKNLSPEAIAHFRQHVSVVDHVDCDDAPRVVSAALRILRENPGPGAPFTGPVLSQQAAAQVINVEGPTNDAADANARLACDPAGYFVIDVSEGCLRLRHYHAAGHQTLTLVGRTARALYLEAIARALVSRLDHAAYLGRELARAEAALSLGVPFVQDADQAPVACLPESLAVMA